MKRKPKYTIEEIKQRIAPVAKQYGVSRVSLFGSYARSEARAKSDVDLLIDDPRRNVRGFKMGGLYGDLEDALKTKIDIVMARTLSDDNFSKKILNEEILLYAENT